MSRTMKLHFCRHRIGNLPFFANEIFKKKNERKTKIILIFSTFRRADNNYMTLIVFHRY